MANYLDLSQPINTANQERTFGDDGSGNNRSQVGQFIKPSANAVNFAQANFWLMKNGNPADSVQVQLYNATLTGSTLTVSNIVGTSTSIDGSSLPAYVPGGATEQIFNFTIPLSLIAGNYYFIAIKRTGGLTPTDEYAIGASANDDYANGGYADRNATTLVWNTSTPATPDLAFRTYYTDLQINISDSLTLSESIGLFLTSVNVSDILILSENIVMSMSIPNQTVSDILTFTESISAQVYFPVNVNNTLTFTENIVISVSSQPVIKTYQYKVYDSTGVTLLKTWIDVASEPTFTQEINGVGSEMKLILARTADNYGEGTDVDFGLQVKVSAIDTEAPNGVVIFIGSIADYKPKFGNAESVEVTLLGYGMELDNYLLDNGTTTTFTYNSQDPGAILRDVIDKYRTLGGTLNYTTSTIELTSTTVSYTFNTNTILECIQKCLELAPLGWYWYIDQATNLVHFHPKASSSVYNFTLSKDIQNLEAEKRSEEIVNIVYFTGGGSPVLYQKYTNPASIGLYGRKALRYTDQRVTLAATATTIALTIMNTHNLPEIRLTAEILDNNTFSDGFNIESIKVGDIFNLRNISGGIGNYIDLTIVNFQVLRVEYTPSIVKVISSTQLPDVNKRISDIYRNLLEGQTVNNPANPTGFIILNVNDTLTFTENISLTIV